MKKTILFFALLTFTALSSCNQEDLVEKDFEKDFEKNEWKKDKDDKDKKWKKACFELVYPIAYTMPDETTIVGNDEKEVWTAIKNWYEDHPDVKAKPELVYPVDIEWKNEDVQTINDEDEMIQAKKDCKDGDKKETCFELVFPIAVTLPDGTIVAGNTKKELDKTIKTWYKDHPNVEVKPNLNYPIEIIFDDGSTQAVDDEEELATVKDTCDNDNDDND
ncbi:MAG: hypothetical protein AAF573_20420 [Bacteroidota bacterium]